MQMVMIMLMAMVVVMPFTDLWELDAMHPVICGIENGNAINPVTSRNATGNANGTGNGHSPLPCGNADGNGNAHDNGYGMPFTL